MTFNRLLSGLAIAVAILVMTFTAYQTYDNLGLEPTLESIDLLGFDSPENDLAFDKLIQSFNSAINSFGTKAESAKTTLLWIGLMVTILTGVSTLISSIQATKDTPDAQKKALVIIAILTFVATIGNYGTTTFNGKKDDAVKKKQELITMRNEFTASYFKAKDASEQKKIIAEYENRLGDTKPE
ncbi:MAG: hypothetical protein WDO14_24255 [Bacteroidota bacterium]